LALKRVEKHISSPENKRRWGKNLATQKEREEN